MSLDNMFVNECLPFSSKYATIKYYIDIGKTKGGN